MFLLALVRKSLANRLLATALTIASIALSVTLLLGIENVRSGMRQSFSNTISRTDLIVGARGGSLQLLLYAVFGIGSPTNNVSWNTYRQFNRHPAIAWTIPISLGDSHRGFRVVGTDSSFYRHFRYGDARAVRFESGRAPERAHEVAIGHQVARSLGYGIDSAIVVTHGLHGTGIMDHEEQPFRVVGILARTFTPVDRSLYVTLEGIDAVHEGFMSAAQMPGGAAAARPNFAAPEGATGGAAPRDFSPPGATRPNFAAPGIGPQPAVARSSAARDSTDAAATVVGDRQTHEPEQITAFFLGAKSRIASLQLQREINTHADEALLAILPGVALAEMWRGIGYAEDALLVVTFFVVGVGLIGMLLSLYSSLEARRREMAILRAVGTGARRIVALLVLESGILGMAGTLLGVGLVYALLVLLKGFVETSFGLYLPIQPPSNMALLYLGVVIVASFLLGLIPALKAYRNSLADGLSVRI